jgi:HD-GYP domain-containing protein (c-di-GMP phosphodiesterase class II)
VIGKIVLDESMLNKDETFTDQERKEMKQHPVMSYRILNSFDDTLDLAESILAHHESWDGSGYPKGLKNNEIPKLARIIAVAKL